MLQQQGFAGVGTCLAEQAAGITAGACFEGLNTVEKQFNGIAWNGQRFWG
jgi:hypothetical protein